MVAGNGAFNNNKTSFMAKKRKEDIRRSILGYLVDTSFDARINVILGISKPVPGAL